MLNSLTEVKVSELADMVRDRFGLNFPRERWKDLHGAVAQFQREEASFSTASECLDYLLSPTVADSYLEQFINRLTIGETFFFRDSNALKVLEFAILPKLRDRGSGINGSVRIWSAACSTGEEPYTLAMICRRSGLNAKIFGTDIDSKALTKAREGCYRKWSFRSEDLGFRDIFFRKVGSNSFLLDSTIKRMVNLSRLNLIEAAVPASLRDMDVIFCRNVLMYFSSEGVRAVLDKLWDCLTPGGWLIATPSESGLLSSHGRFEPVNIDGVLVYRKNEDYEPQCRMVFDGFKFRDEGQAAEHSSIEDIAIVPPLLPDQNIVDVNPAFEPVEADIVIGQEPVTPEPPVQLSDAVDGKGLLDQGDSLRVQGDTVGAAALYKKVAALDCPRELKAAAYLGIAGIKADSGFAEDAALWCGRAIELDRVCPSAYFLLGQISLQQGDRDKALAHMRNAIFLDSEFIMAHVLLGNIYMEIDDKNAALRHFRISMQELEKMDQDEPVPCSDNTTAGRLVEMVRLVQQQLV